MSFVWFVDIEWDACGAPRMTRYAELQTTTNFSFLRGASHPWEMVVGADALGSRRWGSATATAWPGWCGPGGR